MHAVSYGLIRTVRLWHRISRIGRVARRLNDIWSEKNKVDENNESFFTRIIINGFIDIIDPKPLIRVHHATTCRRRIDVII